MDYNVLLHDPSRDENWRLEVIEEGDGSRGAAVAALIRRALHLDEEHALGLLARIVDGDTDPEVPFRLVPRSGGDVWGCIHPNAAGADEPPLPAATAVG
ncbi:hypothetical protein [Kitasatospora sp. NPDC088134]|uniref:hypothetical protein n=1 Tax=Kitasatospora sp. NPDC088134 TaxID=3364071 RepID=UPI0037FBEA33